MKKLVSLLLAALLILSVAAASADAFFTPKNLSDLRVAFPGVPSNIPTVKVVHDEYSNTYTVTASETPVWACANLWYNGQGNVDSITFNGNVATFKGTKAQIGLWWLGGPYYAQYVGWYGKGDFPTYSSIYNYIKSLPVSCGAFIVIEEDTWGWNVHTEKMSYSGDEALLIGYADMNVWYTRGGIPVKVTVFMNEDPFQTGKELDSASVTYTRDGKYSGHWYISNVEANYKNDSVAKVSVDYNDTTEGRWLRYGVTLASGGTLKYTR